MPHTHALESTLIDHEFAIMQYVVGGQRLHMNFVRERFGELLFTFGVSVCSLL